MFINYNSTRWKVKEEKPCSHLDKTWKTWYESKYLPDESSINLEKKHPILEWYKIFTSNYRQYHTWQWKTSIIFTQVSNGTRMFLIIINSILPVLGNSVRQRQDLKCMTIGKAKALFRSFVLCLLTWKTQENQLKIKIRTTNTVQSGGQLQGKYIILKIHFSIYLYDQ